MAFSSVLYKNKLNPFASILLEKQEVDLLEKKKKIDQRHSSPSHTEILFLWPVLVYSCRLFEHELSSSGCLPSLKY